MCGRVDVCIPILDAEANFLGQPSFTWLPELTSSALWYTKVKYG